MCDDSRNTFNKVVAKPLLLSKQEYAAWALPLAILPGSFLAFGIYVAYKYVRRYLEYRP